MAKILMLAVLGLLFVSFVAAQTPLQLNLLENPGLAVCNDGTPGGYYIRKGDPSTWLVHLQGGFWCWNEANCAQRYKDSPGLMSSSPWPQTMNVDGLFNPDCSQNHGFCNATVVYVPYCSSDGHAGTTPASDATWGWHFQGHNIIMRIISDLISVQGLGSSARNTQLLLSGCSAGGRGATFNADHVGDAVRAAGVVNYKALFDSAWWIDLQPPAASPVESLMDVSRTASDLFSGKNIASQECLRAYSDPTEQWKCLFPIYALPFVKTPYVVNVFGFDAFQVPYDINAGPPYSGANLDWVLNEFRPTVLETLHKIDPPRFSAACYTHCSTENQRYFTDKVNGYSAADIVNNFFFESPGPIRMEDDCTGFACGQICNQN